MRRQRGFSLIELMVVLLVVGLLMGMAAISIKSTGRVAGFKEAVEQFKSYDEHTRHQARGFSKHLQLVIDLDKSQMIRLDAQAGNTVGEPLSLSGTAAIKELVIGGKRFTGGKVTVPCSPSGYSPCYAVLVQGSSEARQWLLVLGLTGQILDMANESEAISALEIVSRGRSGSSGAAAL